MTLVQSPGQSQYISNKNNLVQKKSQQSKASVLSRNQIQPQQTEDLQQIQTKTIQISLSSLTHSHSQKQLLSQHVYKLKGDTDDIHNAHNIKNSFKQQTLVSISKPSIKNRKSPSPPKMKTQLLHLNDLQQKPKPIMQSSKRSVDKKASTKPININYQGSKDIPKNVIKTSGISPVLSQPLTSQSKRLSAANNQNSIAQNRSSLSSQQSFQSFQKKCLQTPSSQLPKNLSKANLNDTQLQKNSVLKSPRMTIGASSNTSGNSIYSITADSLTNSSLQNSKDRKMNISEKLVPKGKKKRTNAQKQPKQISITREQLNIIPFLSLQATQNPQIRAQQERAREITQTQQYNEVLYDQNQFQKDHKSKEKNETLRLSGQVQSQNNTNNIDQTPVAKCHNARDIKDFLQGHPKVVTLPQLQYPEQDKRYSHDVFSFQGLSQNIVNHDQEESKEVVGFFNSGEFVESTLGNETQNRPSFDGSNQRRSTQEIPTPVFSGNHRRQSDFRMSDKILHLDVKLTEESPLETLKIKKDKVKTNTYQREQDIQTERVYDDFQTTVFVQQQQKMLKKVNSTNDLGIGASYATVHVQRGLQRNASNGSFLSRMKNYFSGSQKSQGDQEIQMNKTVLYRCNCGYSGKSYACVRAIKWLQHANNYSESEYQKNKELYEGLIKLDISSGSETQIDRDIPRTFPNTDPFMNTNEGQQRLSRVLNAFSQYFRSIGYVQGMNFIVGALLMHSSEDIAFWLFVSLIEDYEMRDIYQQGLPGLYKHSQIIQLLQMEHLGDLYQHFCIHNILIEMYASDWIFALFSNIIPLSEYHHFLDKFFIGGWSFFYKFSLTFLNCLQDEVIDCEDISEILTMIKLKYIKKDLLPSLQLTKFMSESDIDSQQIYSDSSINSPSKSQGQMNQMKNLFKKLVLRKDEVINSESFNDNSVWEKVVALSCKEWEENFNENFVQQLLSSFDPEKLVFRQSLAITPSQASIVEPALKQANNEQSFFKEQPYYKSEKGMQKEINNYPLFTEVQVISTERIKNSRQNKNISSNLDQASLIPKNTRNIKQQVKKPQRSEK